MAQTNFTSPQNQEPNLKALAASWGLLMCMVATIMGIKLWRFKRRLSFEQSAAQNGVAGGSGTPVIVSRRSKQQPKYKKDKRYSQQIYESVEIHGVFRQRNEDDFEIQQNHQLPPVGLRQLSESTSTALLPPPRHKRREKVHSTAFEDLEIATESVTAASSIDLTAIHESNTKISLTFEEFERQFKLKETSNRQPEPSNLNHEFIEIPVPPLRVNRSSSAMTRPEKSQRLLKLSQSITIPEMHKTIEQRANPLMSRPTEDLTKCADYDGPIRPEHRPTGYIRYEEVDDDLQEHYERDLNGAADSEHQQFSDSCESPGGEPALRALQNEYIIYKNDLSESTSQQFCEKNEPEILESSLLNIELFNSFYSEKNDRAATKALKDFNSGTKLCGSGTHSDNDMSLEPKEFIKENQDKSILITKLEKDYLGQDHTLTKPPPRDVIKETSNRGSDNFGSNSHQEDFDAKFNNWPQFEEKIETPKVNVRKFNDQDLGTQRCLDEYKDSGIRQDNTDASQSNETRIKTCEVRNFIVNGNDKTGKVTFDSSAAQNVESEEYKYSAIKQRRPTGFVRANEYSVTYDYDNDETTKGQAVVPHSSVEIVEVETNFKDTDELKHSNDFVQAMNNEIFNDINTPDDFQKLDQELSHSSPKVRFEQEYQQLSECENNTESLLKQRRPTGFIRKAELDELDEQMNAELIENENKYLKKTHPTNFLGKEAVTKQVNFDLNEDFDGHEKGEFGNELLKQRRPTGFVSKKKMPCLSPAPTINHDTNKDNNDIDDRLWQEMKKEVDQDFSCNFEAEFAKIRHSYEQNEADFLEVKEDLKNSCKNNLQTPTGFGKSIEDDWHNFEALKLLNETNQLESSHGSQTILKDHKVEDDIKPKPRKSKVTFDFKAQQRVIPPRNSHHLLEGDSSCDQDVNKMSNTNYNAEPASKPRSISLFASQISDEDNVIEDSWSAVRKHRNMTVQFQNISSTDSKLSPSPSTLNAPPKPSYRNPMAQLAIQRAKDVRAHMDGHKSRSINSRHTDSSKGQKPEDCGSTEA